MKKTLLTLSFLFTAIFVNAQCTPDPQFTAPGIYPDSAAGLTPAYVGQSYNQDITIICPLDTIVDFNGAPLPVVVQTIELTSVTGLPSNFSYACDPDGPTGSSTSCIFNGGSTACAVLFSTTNPTSADIGSYQIIFNTITTAAVPSLGGITIPQTDVIDYYYLNIVDNNTSTLNQFDHTTFELKSAYVDDIMNQAKIQFISGSPQNIVFQVYNLLGEEIDNQKVASSRGVNTINLNTSSYAKGMYLYSINNGSDLLTKRMVIKN